MEISTTKNGFSLVELMVVVSIVSLLTALSLPRIAIFQIKAAQTEWFINARTMATLAHSYHSENAIYPLGFTYGYQTVLTPHGHVCAANELGFATTSCTTMRYHYSFSGTGGASNFGDPTRRRYFTIQAHNGKAVNGGTTYEYGSRGIPTRLCKPVAPFSSYYLDVWELHESGVIKETQNMAKSCF